MGMGMVMGMEMEMIKKNGEKVRWWDGEARRGREVRRKEKRSQERTYLSCHYRP